MINAAPLAMFLTTFIALIAGYPVALTLAGVALIFALIGTIFGIFNPSDLGFTAGRLFGLVTNQTLIAIPLFVFMGVTLEKTKIAESFACGIPIISNQGVGDVEDQINNIKGGKVIPNTLQGTLENILPSLDDIVALDRKSIRNKAREFLSLDIALQRYKDCLLYTSPSPRDS